MQAARNVVILMIKCGESLLFVRNASLPFAVAIYGMFCATFFPWQLLAASSEFARLFPHESLPSGPKLRHGRKPFSTKAEEKGCMNFKLQKRKVNYEMFQLQRASTLVYPRRYFSFSKPNLSRIALATERSCFSLSLGRLMGTDVIARRTPSTLRTPYLKLVKTKRGYYLY